MIRNPGSTRSGRGPLSRTMSRLVRLGLAEKTVGGAYQNCYASSGTAQLTV